MAANPIADTLAALWSPVLAITTHHQDVVPSVTAAEPAVLSTGLTDHVAEGVRQLEREACI
jgi:hypothetical protein